MSLLKLSDQESLLFLRTYSFEDAKAMDIELAIKSGTDNDLAMETKAIINDVRAHITINAEKQQVILEVEIPHEPGKTFTSVAPYDYIGKGANASNLPKTVKRRAGVFYARHQNTHNWAASNILIQQFPPYDWSQPAGGRIVMDCWTKGGIIGVFKTNEENYIAGAHGTWANRLRASADSELASE